MKFNLSKFNKVFERGNAQKGLLAHLAALFLLFFGFEVFSFGPPLETKKKKLSQRAEIL